jgi:hypothetical protein
MSGSIYWAFSEAIYATTIDPSGVTSARQFYDRFGETGPAQELVIGGTNYYELTGPLPGAWSLATPSGRSAFIFDAAGTRIDWCYDTGEDNNWRKRWPAINAMPLSDNSVRGKFGI